ncbi:hypothetical protein G9A89_008733 [Geosiphon pyriformis]|nr:hypothetical protein G9A89_008733 [Geosiphon pyriformis]
MIYDSTWYGKPHCLSPPECARYGWENIYNNKLQCVTCTAEVEITYSGVRDEEIAKQQEEKYHKKLSTAHFEHCSWGSNPCTDEIYRFRRLRWDHAVQGFQHRAHEMLKLKDKLPVIKTNLTEEFTHTVFEALRLEESIDPLIASTAGCLSLFGWEYQHVLNTLDVIQCKLCFRRCAVINFRNIAKERENLTANRTSGFLKQTQSMNQISEDQIVFEPGFKINEQDSTTVHHMQEHSALDERSQKERLQNLDNFKNSIPNDDFVEIEGVPKHADQRLFDVQSEHKHYCPWITGDGKPGRIETIEELQKKQPGWHLTLEAVVKSTCVSKEGFLDDQKSGPQMDSFRQILSPIKKSSRSDRFEY